MESQFGPRPKLALRIKSTTAVLEDGRPALAWKWVTNSPSPKSTLYEIRRALKGRELTREERLAFDDQELIGREISYDVTHVPRRDGGTFASVDNIQPADVLRSPRKDDDLGF